MKKVLVINALNGALALAVRKRYPNAEIWCGEYFPYYHTLLNKLGFNVINWDDLVKTDMKFDAIVGNPPFQEVTEDGRKDQASNMWSKFWSQSFKLVSPGGTVSLITPTSWLSPSADLKGEYKVNGRDRLWDVFDQYSSYADVQNVAQHFPGVGSTFGYVKVDTSGNAGLTFSDGASTQLGFLPKSEHAEVLRELDLTNNIGSNFSVDQDNKSTLRVSIPLSRVLDPNSIEILSGSVNPTAGSDKPGLYLYVYVNTQQEADHVRQRIIDCLDILNTHCRYSGFLNIKTLKMIKY